MQSTFTYMTQIENDMDSMIAILYTIQGRVCNNCRGDHAGILSDMGYSWLGIGLILTVLTVNWHVLTYSVGRVGKRKSN